MRNADIARVFDRLATMLEIDGANPFRIRAYREAARIVESHPEAMESLISGEGALEGIKGIGKDLAQKIRDLVGTGTTALYEEMKGKVPVEVVELTELQGLGPKRVKTLMTELGVRSRADLEKAAHAGKLRELPGFGPTLEQKVLKSIATAQSAQGRMLLHGAWEVAHALVAHVRAVRGVTHAEPAGSFRRRRETVGDLDIVVTGGAAETVMEAFVAHPDVAEVIGRGETKSSVRLINGLQVDLRHVPPESYGAALVYFTGSKAHNIELRRIAIEKGWSLNEYGLTEGERVIAGRTEEDVYRALGMEWIPPELREAGNEITQAIAGRLPRLVDQTDLRADLHIHTDRSDGQATLEQMVRAAQKMGYRYCAITEHSRSLAMAFGFDTARVRRSVEEIAEVRKRVPGIRVLHGLEVDILGDGSLDLDDEGLALLDWVVVSLHARLAQSRDEMTRRLLRAIDHPRVDAVGHPTARRIGQREAVDVDLEAVFEHAAERGVAMEINAQPDRSDLSDVNARLAASKGVPLVIDTDAHSTAQLEFMRYGVFAARRAGLTARQVLNTLDLADFVNRRSRWAARPVSEVGATSGARTSRSRAADGTAATPPVSRSRVGDAAPASRRGSKANKAPAPRRGSKTRKTSPKRARGTRRAGR
ncbi:MAG: DNA polymerase/3'-5' exonuclease PolX [Candidatus Eisenbacteria bacterium]